MLTRQQRTRNYRVLIDKLWDDYFWYSVMNYFRYDSISFSNLSRNPNISLERVLNNPHYPWSIIELSANPRINYTMVKNTEYLPWNYDVLSLNSSITWFDIMSDPHLPWNWRNLAEKDGITIDIIRLKADVLNRRSLIHNPSVSLEIIENNPDINWDYQEIPMRKDLDFDLLLDLCQKYSIVLLCQHWLVISEQKYITWNIVQENPQYAWNFNSLSRNPNITVDILINNRQYPFSFKHFTFNDNCTFRDVLQYPEENWDWEHISENLIKPEDFIQHANLPFCYNSIQMNSQFTFEDIINIPLLMPNMNYISLNPSIKLRDIRENKGYTWDWFWLCSSEYKHEKNEFILNRLKKWLAAYRIQQEWFRAKYDYNNPIGKRFIEKGYNECFNSED